MSVSQETVRANTGILSAVLQSLRADSAIQAVLGDPARLFDSETENAYLPCVFLERYEQTDRDAHAIQANQHTLTFASHSTYGGMDEANAILNALKTATERLSLDLQNQTLVLAYVVYSDVTRRPDNRSFRGVIRIRILTEEVL